MGWLATKNFCRRREEGARHFPFHPTFIRCRRSAAAQLRSISGHLCRFGPTRQPPQQRHRDRLATTLVVGAYSNTSLTPEFRAPRRIAVLLTVVGTEPPTYILPNCSAFLKTLLESNERHRQKEGYQSQSRSHQRPSRIGDVGDASTML
jgi:hypothetical protein